MWASRCWTRLFRNLGGSFGSGSQGAGLIRFPAPCLESNRAHCQTANGELEDPFVVGLFPPACHPNSLQWGSRFSLSTAPAGKKSRWCYSSPALTFPTSISHPLAILSYFPHTRLQRASKRKDGYWKEGGYPPCPSGQDRRWHGECAD